MSLVLTYTRTCRTSSGSRYLYSSLSRHIHSAFDNGSGSGSRTDVERPQNAFSGIVNGRNGDERWFKYNKLDPEAGRLFQDFVSLISKATIKVTDLSLKVDGTLQSQLPAIENDRTCDTDSNATVTNFIEIFRIDLKEFNEALEGTGELHPCHYDKMHIVRLPMAIPEQSSNLASDTLWITGDCLAVFKVTRSIRLTVVLGNPGIGKSWWQWQYLLYSLRPDVYHILSEGKDFPPNYQGEETSPSIIIRYDAGNEEAHVFYMEQKDSVIVHQFGPKFDKDINLFELLNTQDTVVLYEPSKSTDGVPYDGLDAMSIVATVSPDRRRYKEFLKNGGRPVFFSCPSKLEKPNP